MAINASAPQNDMLQRRSAVLAAGVSATLSIAGAAAGIVYLAMNKNLDTVASLCILGLVAVMALAFSSALQLLRGRNWPQQFLLAFWLVVAAVGLVLMLWTGLYGKAAWWDASLPPPMYVALGLIVVGAVAGGLMVMASAAGSRLRFGTLTTVSVVVAATVVIAINLIAYDRPIHKDLESLGRYGISERTAGILDDVKEPIRITCIYTSADERKLGSEFRGGVMDLLEEMQLHMKKQNRDMELVNVTNDTDKAKLLTRLRSQMGNQATKHVELLKGFDADAQKLLQDLQAQTSLWETLSADSYLRLWSLPAEITSILSDLKQDIEEARTKIQREMKGSGLTDYAKLVEELKTKLETTRKNLDEVAAFLKRVAKMPAAAAANQKDALASIAKAQAAVAKMTQSLADGKAAAPKPAASAPGDADAAAPVPTDPAKALKQLVEAARAASSQLTDTIGTLEAIAGPANVQLVSNSSCWIYNRRELSQQYLDLAQAAEAVATATKGYADKATPAAQAEWVRKVQPTLAELQKTFTGMVKASVEAVQKLSTLDEPSKKILDQAAGGQLLDPLTKPLTAMLDQIAKLPPLKSDSVASDITQDNIVIIETGGKTKVVAFDEIWPLKGRSFGPADSAGKDRRTFNGDSAISSKILTMTQKPFATVLLAYLPVDQQTMQMMQMMGMGNSTITPDMLGGLKKRLEESNLTVAEWKLSDPMPKPTDAQPQVVVVLPPGPALPPMRRDAPPPPSFGPEHLAKISQAIDAGTPAIFLARWVPPSNNPYMSSAGYAPNEYLQKDWGINVQTTAGVLMAIPDETEAGRFTVDLRGFSWIPLNTFSDQAIGRPLRGQRMLWSEVCPIRVKTMAGVKVDPLLTITPDRNNLWATTDLPGLVEQVQAKGFVAPGPTDIKPPMDLAVAATRETPAKKGAKAAQIVVMGLASSLMDGYMDQQVPVRGAKGDITFDDPPLANADLMVNSVYWLAGRGQNIAAGPVQVRPINVTQNTRSLLWAVCVLGLPALVLGLGGIVLLRRRS